MSVRWVPTGLPQIAFADRAPLATDDRTTGARIGADWIWDATGRRWTCQDDTPASAIWVELQGAAGAQPLSLKLSALAGMDTTPGAVEQTGDNTFAKRAFGVAAGTSILTRGDGDGRYQPIGSYQPLDATLTAYAAVTWSAGVQVPVLTGADTFALRTVGAGGATELIDRAAGDARYQPLDDLGFLGIVDGDSDLAVLAAHAYSLIRITSGTRTHTLPEIGANSLPVGWWVRFKNRSGNTLAVQRAGSDTINAGTTSANVTNNTSLSFVVATGSTWETT